MAVTRPAAPEPTLDPVTTEPTADPHRRGHRATHRTGRRAALVGGAAGLVMLLLGSCGLIPSSTTRLISLINSYRSSIRVQQLGANLDLIAKAQMQAQAMAASGQIFHSNLAANNPYPWRKLGENVGIVSASQGVDAANAAFLASPDHRANMGDPAYNYVGTYAYDDGRGNLWVVEEFMQL